MFQQNPYQQQQSFGTQQNQQSQGQQVHLQEQDLANFVLSELKRTAREYTTGALEAANPQIRQTFQTLLQKTLQDQALVFQEIQKLGGYEIQPAQQQQIQQELQKHGQCATKLQSFVQMNLGQVSNAAFTQQQQQQNQFMAGQQQYQQNQQQQQNPLIAQQQSFQPLHTINASSYPNAVQSSAFSHNAANQQASYNTLQGKSQHEQELTQSHGISASDYGTSGTGRSGYYAGSGVSEAGVGTSSLQGHNQSFAARNQTTSGTSSENSYISKHHDGSKYSF